ncbi:MAG: hypothetical protein M0R74_10795 [Dehalococcoidia bacterium]|jgi:hypothetical protein|nr:hypothetical protein [Dehalococcoidia bacterium]
MSNVDHEDAIAYGWYMILLIIIAGAVVYAGMSVMMNGFIDFSNDRIADGDLSPQTVGAMKWNLGAYAWAPVIALVVYVLWSVVRAIEQKRLGS